MELLQDMKTLWKLRGKRQSEKEQEQEFWKGNHNSTSLEVVGLLGKGENNSNNGCQIREG